MIRIVASFCCHPGCTNDESWMTCEMSTKNPTWMSQEACKRLVQPTYECFTSFLGQRDPWNPCGPPYYTVGGGNPANQLKLAVHPSINKVLNIPGGAGFLPSPISCQDTGRTKVMLVELRTASPLPVESFCQHDSGQNSPQEILFSNIV